MTKFNVKDQVLYTGKSELSLNEMARLAIDYEGDGYVTGYPIVSGDDAYILNGAIEDNEEYITINQWVPVFPESLKPVSPSLTDDQQVVFNQLCQIFMKQSYKSKMQAVYIFINKGISDEFLRLDSNESNQVLAAFAEWGMEKGEE